MAITKQYVSGMGVTLPGAYIRVREITGDGNRLVSTAHVYATKSARESNAEPVAIHTLAFVPNLTPGADNFLTQAYLAFKAEQVFEGSLDC